MRALSEWKYQVLALLELAEAHRVPISQRRIVVVYAPGHLGDFLQLTPMLRTLRTRLPACWIVWLVGGWAMEVATRHADWADEIVLFSPQKEILCRHDGKWEQGVLRQWSHLCKIRKQGVGILIGTMPEKLIARFMANTLRPPYGSAAWETTALPGYAKTSKPSNENKWGRDWRKTRQDSGGGCLPGVHLLGLEEKMPHAGHPCMGAITVDSVESKVLGAIYAKDT